VVVVRLGFGAVGGGNTGDHAVVYVATGAG
jgi:hypothetical protein